MAVDFSSIPEDVFEKLKDCTTAEDVIELGKQYDIEITQEEAEAALAAGGEDLEGLGKHSCQDMNCAHCKHYDSFFRKCTLSNKPTGEADYCFLRFCWR